MARPRAFDQAEAIAAAAELFLERGFEATSVRDLTARLGVSTSSLYAAFGGKEGVFMAAMRHAADCDKAMVLGLLDGAATVSDGLRTLFRGVAQQFIDAPNPFLSLTLRAGIELADRNPEVLAFLRGHLDELAVLLAQRLETAEARGELRLLLPSRALARHLLLSVLNLMFAAKLQPDPAELDAAVQAILMAVPVEAGAPEVLS